MRSATIGLGGNGPAAPGPFAFEITFDGKVPCPGDLDGSGTVDAADLSTLLGAWGTPAGDTNGDGTTDASDLSTLLGAWGPCDNCDADLDGSGTVDLPALEGDPIMPEGPALNRSAPSAVLASGTSTT